jgi:hypothetical protein
MSKMVEDNEPNTLDYEFYLNNDETKCVVRETYANSEAALAHATSIASQTILPKVLGVASIDKFDVYGNPSEELQKALTSLNAQTYNLVTGFSRL